MFVYIKLKHVCNNTKIFVTLTVQQLSAFVRVMDSTDLVRSLTKLFTTPSLVAMLNGGSS